MSEGERSAEVWGRCHWIEEPGVDLVHPEDLEAFRSERREGRVFQQVGEQDGYLLVRYHEAVFRARAALFRRVPTPAFGFGDRVQVPRKGNGVVVGLMWHFRHDEAFFTVEVKGKRLKKRYYACDLVQAEAKDQGMSDQDLRALERRWAETGTLEDEGAYLLALTRAGELRAEALELAACCGQQAAALALNVAEPSLDRLQAWFATHESSSLVRARFALAAAYATVDHAGGNVRSFVTVRAFDDWLLCPCDEHLSALRTRSEALALLSSYSARCTLRAVEFAHGETPASFSSVIEAATPELAPQQLWAAIAAEVVPWLLQRGDPVALRVERRQNDAPTTGMT